MKIFIVGAGGFLGKSLTRDLNKNSNYWVNSYYRQQLDLTKIDDLRFALETWKPDLFINCALSGAGRLITQDTPLDFYNNLLINENILSLAEEYNFKYIHFSSGAAFDRTKDIVNLKEGEFYSPPSNYYSLSKYISNKRVLDNKNVINIRIFNVFNELEKPNRFIYSNIVKYIKKEGLEIWGEALFDFFWAGDLTTLIEHYINNVPNDYEEINAVYPEKYLLSGITDIINQLSDYQVPVKIIDGINKNYYGNGEKLAKLNLPFMGLRAGIEATYQELLKTNGL